MKSAFDVIVIGGGQAGLASGYYLQRKGLSFQILEASGRAAGSWPKYYDSLKLFSPAKYSSLPGFRFPGNPNRYPLRDEVIDYLQEYAERFRLPILTHHKVETVKKTGNGFEVQTTDKKTYYAKVVISATGSFHSPYNPKIAGLEQYRGQVLHASEYRNPIEFKNKRVVVVGRGNSAVQIAVELSDVSHTSIAALKPIQFMKQTFLGKDLHFWLIATGFDKFQFWKFGKQAPNPSGIIDLGRYEERVSAGNPDQRLMFKSLYEDGVIWPDGTKEPVDAVIFATGYHHRLHYLEKLGALDHEGRPLQMGGVSTQVSGLFFVGIYGQRSFASATLRGVGGDARYVVRNLIRQLKIK